MARVSHKIRYFVNSLVFFSWISTPEARDSCEINRLYARAMRKLREKGNAASAELIFSFVYFWRTGCTIESSDNFLQDFKPLHFATLLSL